MNRRPIPPCLPFVLKPPRMDFETPLPKLDETGSRRIEEGEKEEEEEPWMDFITTPESRIIEEEEEKEEGAGMYLITTPEPHVPKSEETESSWITVEEKKVVGGEEAWMDFLTTPEPPVSRLIRETRKKKKQGEKKKKRRDTTTTLSTTTVDYVVGTLGLHESLSSLVGCSNSSEVYTLAVSGSRKDFCPLRCLPRKTPIAIARHFPLRRSPTSQNSSNDPSIPLHRSTFPLPPILPHSSRKTQRDRYPRGHVVVQPNIQVVSVTVGHHDKKKSCEVYGTIYVNDDNEICQIYKRGWDDAQTIGSLNNALTLTGGALLLSEPVLHMNLKEKGDDDRVIIKGSFPLDTWIEDGREELKCLTVEVDWGCIYVKYVSICYGVVADVAIGLRRVGCDEKGGNNMGDINIFGAIYARYESMFGAFASGDESLRFELFNLPSDQPQKVKSGSPISLLMSRLAVPVYASLIIEANIMESGTNHQVAFGKAELKYINNVRDVDIIRGGDDEKLYVKVWPKWYEPVTLQESYSGGQNLNQVPRHLKFLSRKEFPEGDALLEVFTIVIGFDRDERLRVYGDVKIRHTMGYCELFSRDEDNALHLPPGPKSLPIQSPLEVMGSDKFSMVLDLKDSTGHMDINGYVNSTVEISQRDASWCDRFMCSVVEGQNGYAAVYYVILSEAVRAKVSVALLCKTSDTDHNIRVSGRVVAWYGKFEYPTRFEKDYYRSVLFEMPEGLGLRVSNLQGDGSRNRFKLPLSKYVVPVPIDSSLVIGVDLCAHNKSCREELRDVVDLKIGTSSDYSQRIVGRDLDVIVSVNWSCV